MERAVRPEVRPGYRTRSLIAVALSIWAVLQALTLVVVPLRGGTPADSMSFFLTGILTLYLAGASWVAWVWAGRARPRSYADEDDAATQHHRGLAGEYEPPTRW